MKDTMLISLSDSTFSDMKRDWTNIMQEAIAKAKELGVSKGSVTMKTDFVLNKMPVTTEKDYREADVPVFKWKVSLAVKVENSRDGELGGEYELTKQDGTYGLKTLNGQTSMFDMEEDDEDLEDEE